MKQKLTKNWLISGLSIFFVMGIPSAAQSSDISELGPNFRQVALGMTVDEINSLDSVTHGYMPKLTFIEKDREKNVLVCKPLYFDVELLPHNHEIGWTDDAPKKSESRSSDKYSYELAPSGTFRCGEYFSYDMNLSLPLANFNFMVLSFWEGKLRRLSFGFSDSNTTGDGASNEVFLEFHNQLKEKFDTYTEAEKSEETKETVRTRWWSNFAKDSEHYQRTIIVKEAFEKNHLPIHDLFTGMNKHISTNVHIIDFGKNDEMKEFGETLFADFVRVQREKSKTKTEQIREKLDKKKKLDKKFLN